MRKPKRRKTDTIVAALGGLLLVCQTALLPAVEGTGSGTSSSWDGAPSESEKRVVDSWTRSLATTQSGRKIAAPAADPDVHPSRRNSHFAFVLREDSRRFFGQWEYAASRFPAAIRGGKTTRHSWLDPKTGLRLTWEVTTFADYPAVDWTLAFENTGERPSPRIHKVRAIDLVAGPVTGREARILHAARGGAPTGIAYQPLQADLAGGVPVRLEPLDGRSSNGYLPFFNLAAGSAGGDCRTRLVRAMGHECGGRRTPRPAPRRAIATGSPASARRAHSFPARLGRVLAGRTPARPESLATRAARSLLSSARRQTPAALRPVQYVVSSTQRRKRHRGEIVFLSERIRRFRA